MKGTHNLPRLVWDKTDSRSQYDEVYLSLRVLLLYMKIFVLFPIDETKGATNKNSIVNGLRFKWSFRWTFRLVMLTAILIFYSYIGQTDFALAIENPVESMIYVTIMIIHFLAALLNLYVLVFKAKHWLHYFHSWQELDQTLDISNDTELRQFVKKSAIAFFTLITNYVILSLALGMIKFVHIITDNTKPLLGLVVFLYVAITIPCTLLLEVVFICLCKAMVIRIRRMDMQLKNAFDVSNNRRSKTCFIWTPDDHLPNAVYGHKIDISSEISRLRVAAYRVMDIVRQTNDIMGFCMLVNCSLNIFMMTVSIYLLIHMGSTNAIFECVKLTALMFSGIRIVCICLFTEKASVQVTHSQMFV